MDMKREITLSDGLMDRCRVHGIEAVRIYANGGNTRSHALSSHGADTDPALWAMSKGGECAFAEYAGLDPVHAVNWENRADGGHDVVAFGGLKWDVKTIKASYRYLCWPIKKNHLYFGKDFHTLVLVKARPPVFTIERWMTKLAFFCEKLVADGNTPCGITDGTWCVKDEDAWDMDKLVAWLEASGRSAA